MKRFSLEKMFSFIIAAEDVKNSKPHPEGLLKAIMNFDVNPEEILYVDDQSDMFDETNRLGIKNIGFRSKLNRDFSSADFVIDNFSKILKIIDRC